MKQSNRLTFEEFAQISGGLTAQWDWVIALRNTMSSRYGRSKLVTRRLQRAGDAILEARTQLELVEPEHAARLANHETMAIMRTMEHVPE